MSKRLKTTTVIIPYITKEWVSASQTRNYILEDPLSDYLEMYGPSKGILADSKYDDYNEKLDFVKYIMNQGNLFERHIMAAINEKFGDEVQEISSAPYKTRMENTLKEMKTGTPIIYQGMIFNPKDKTYGIPDLLVRSDYINEIVADTLDSSREKEGCNFSETWHYVVIDIKFTTLKLKANGITLLNVGSQKAYKSQLAIYNNCLSHMQGYNSYASYILGRGYEYTSKGEKYMSSDPFSKLGKIDFEGDDIDIIEETNNAIKWRKRLLKEGANWTLPSITNTTFNKASTPELYPNMCISDGSYSRYKKKLAREINEITLLYQCGKTARDNAHMANIYSYKETTSAILGINGQKLGPLVDKFLDVNNGKITPKESFNNKDSYGWKEERKEIFIDFETVSAIYDVTNNKNSLLYLIGSVYEDGYRSFLLDIEGIDYERNNKKERVLIEKFLVYVISIIYPRLQCPNCDKYSSLEIDGELRTSSHYICSGCCYNFCPSIGWWDGNAQCNCDDTEPSNLRVWHYSGEEATRISGFVHKLKEKYEQKDKDEKDEVDKCDKMRDILNRLEFIDLCKVLKEEEMIVKGMVDFSLKTVVGALYDNGLISINYNTLISSGVSSIMACISAMNDHSIPFGDNHLIKEVVKYNEIDCRSMGCILEYMRKEYR